MQRVNVSIHDNANDEFDKAPAIICQKGTAAIVAPYDILRIGNAVDIFLSRERLIELRDTISNYVESQQCGRCGHSTQDGVLCDDCKPDVVLEDQAVLETAADRTPPRE